MVIPIQKKQLSNAIELAAKSKTDPLVSVFMSAYNAGPYLQESVSSILEQSFQDFEFVIINDGSTDDSANFLDSITDPRVRVVHQSNQGLGKAQNDAIRKCNGKYIMRMDADDKSAPDRIEKQVAILENQPDVIMVGCFFRFFGSNGAKSAVSKQPTAHEAILSGMLNGWHTMAHGTIMFRSLIFEKLEGYLLSGAGEDWALLLDASRFGNYAMVPEPLYEMRLHPASNAWSSAEKVVLGFQFARQRHRQFLQDRTDLSVEQFMSNWKRASFVSKARVRLAAYSNVLHRQALLGRFNGQRISPTMRMIAASILDPSKTVGAIWKRFRTGTTRV